MRLAIVAALAVAGPAALAFACSDSTTPVDPGTDAATPTPTGTTTSAPTGDSGSLKAPDGCTIHNTVYLSGRKATNVARTDVGSTADWTDLDRALVEDTKVASVTLEDGQESAYLEISDFKVDLPTAAETWGIEVELKRQATDGGVADSKIDVAVEGKPSRFKFIQTPWPTSIIGRHVYGQEVDTWGVDLFAADVNKATFAARVSAKRLPAAVGPVKATVDSVRVAIYYCDPK